MQAGTSLERDGFLGPIPLLTHAECRRAVEYLRRADRAEPGVWEKARAVHERFLYDLATRPAVLEPVTSALGPDVVLWGVSAVARVPGQAHPWHSDIESCGPDGGFVSVWVGIENTSRDSALQLIAGTHRLGRSVQEVRSRNGIARDDATPDAVFELARKLDSSVRLVVPHLGDGEALVFDGRLWHGSDNRRRRGERLALLFQYAAADRPVRIPDWDELDWPFRIRSEPRPPVIVVSGSAHDGVNDVVPPPSGTTSAVGTVAHRLELPLEDEPSEPWRPFPAFRGPTRAVSDMSCHASVLDAGHSPHPPHAHVEEELLIPLHGEVELVLPESESDGRPRTQRLTPGSFVYYPAGQLHTIRNPGTVPVAYLMFKWSAPVARTDGALETEVVAFDGAARDGDEPFRTEVVLERATACLELLHSHVTVLEPGAGYEPHRDAHDVALVLLEGAIETLGRRVQPQSVVYCGAGELHGVRNAGAGPARYLVFEFHGRPTGNPSLVGRIAAKVGLRSSGS